jgi:RHS repeat-associated protein
MQLKTIAVKDPGQNPLMTYDYTYSPAGNVTAKTTEQGNYAYQYDRLYRLANATNPSSNEAYTYDAVGNRLTSANVTGNWNYNQNNELLNYDGVTYEYDDSGNMTSETDQTGTTTYTYDVDNRLIQILNPQSEIYNYYYDPFGRRLWKDVNGNRTYFLYADEGLIGEYDTSGNESKTYGYAPNSTWTTNPLFQKIGTNYYWYQNDHLGTPQKIIDTSGRTVWSATYTAFGEAVVDPSSIIINNLRFAGQYYDAETGKHYNWNRYYDPKTGTYTQVDPIGFEGGDINLYRYTKGNPITLKDPDGTSITGFREECESFTACMNRCTKIMDPNFFGNNPIANALLGNEVMSLHNFINNLDKDSFIDLAAGQAPSKMVALFSKSYQTNMVLSLGAWHSARLEFPLSQNVLKITQLEIPVKGYRRVQYTTFLFGKNLGKLFAKFNPIFAIKTAWDVGTYGGCLANCAGK